MALYKQPLLGGAALQDFLLIVDSLCRCSPFIPACAPSPAKSEEFHSFYHRSFENPTQNPASPSYRGGCVSPRERRGGARVNEKTTANPRTWPLIGGHLAPQGDGSLDLRCFFRAGRRIVRARFFWYF